MDFLTLTLELFRNADHFIMYIAQTYGWWVYLVLFMIFYSETGIVTWLLIVIISLGAILGNTTNFYIGNWLGNKIYDGSISWIDQDALKKTHDFYEKHGGKTIVLARFVPIVRSFAPLVAGAAKMNPLRFELYSGGGAIVWVGGIVLAGCLFGNIPFIKNNLSLILVVGILAALVPFSCALLIQLWRKYIMKQR